MITVLSSLYRISSSNSRALRVGVLADAGSIPQLFLSIFEDIAKCNFARLEVVVRMQGPAASRRAGVLFRLYDRWDRMRANAAADPFAPAEAADAFGAARRIDAEVSADGEIGSDALEAIRAADLDVLLLVSCRDIRGRIVQIPRHGVWAYRFADGPERDGALALFWQVRYARPFTRVALCVLGDAGKNDRVLCEGVFGGAPAGNISWRAGRARPGWACTSFVIQKLFELHSCGAVRSSEPPSRNAPAAHGRNPSNTEMIAWLAPKIAGKVARRLVTGARAEHWRMAIRVGEQRLLRSGVPDTSGFRWISSPPGHLYADPFLIRREGQIWLFYEHYEYAARRAVIDCAAVLPDGALSEARVALRRNYHLSFPQVFEYGGEIFMVPETGGNRTVELYRAVHFPHEWKLEKVLASNLWAVDTAIWHDGEFWWFFSTLKESRAEGTMLFLFFSRELTGEWKSHPANPICADVRTVRGAGPIFRQDGRLLRPSQDGSVRYGYRLNFQEITTLNPEEYCEQALLTLDPTTWEGLVGLHTYSQCAGAEAIDGCTLATAAETGGYTSAVIAPKNVEAAALI